MYCPESHAYAMRATPAPLNCRWSSRCWAPRWRPTGPAAPPAQAASPALQAAGRAAPGCAAQWPRCPGTRGGTQQPSLSSAFATPPSLCATGQVGGGWASEAGQGACFGPAYGQPGQALVGACVVTRADCVRGAVERPAGAGQGWQGGPAGSAHLLRWTGPSAPAALPPAAGSACWQPQTGRGTAAPWNCGHGPRVLGGWRWVGRRGKGARVHADRAHLLPAKRPAAGPTPGSQPCS